jgi:hypothetical protein
VAVCVPQAEFLRAAARELGGAVALVPLWAQPAEGTGSSNGSSSSNNGSSSSSSSAAADARDCRALWPRCAAIFDGGRVPVGGGEGDPLTIVDLTALVGSGGVAAREFALVRQGSCGARVAAVLQDAFGLQQVSGGGGGGDVDTAARQ